MAEILGEGFAACGDDEGVSKETLVVTEVSEELLLSPSSFDVVEHPVARSSTATAQQICFLNFFIFLRRVGFLLGSPQTRPIT